MEWGNGFVKPPPSKEAVRQYIDIGALVKVMEFKLFSKVLLKA